MPAAIQLLHRRSDVMRMQMTRGMLHPETLNPTLFSVLVEPVEPHAEVCKAQACTIRAEDSVEGFGNRD